MFLKVRQLFAISLYLVFAASIPVTNAGVTVGEAKLSPIYVCTYMIAIAFVTACVTYAMIAKYNVWVNLSTLLVSVFAIAGLSTGSNEKILVSGHCIDIFYWWLVVPFVFVVLDNLIHFFAPSLYHADTRKSKVEYIYYSDDIV